MKSITVFSLLLLPLLLTAQDQGEVQYVETVQFQFEAPEGQEDLHKMLPSSQSSPYVLFFTEKASLYKEMEQDAAAAAPQEWTASEGNTTMKVVIARPDNRMYKDLAEGRKTEQREFFGRKFLIQDELDAFSWKLTGEQKTLLEYPCFRAVHEEEDRVVEAWFTPQIPVSTGPGIYGQLPGMVLEVSVNDGQRKIQATKVTFTEVSADQLEKPKKGKEVTQEEFDQIEAEKMKEMEEQGGGRMMIRIGN